MGHGWLDLPPELKNIVTFHVDLDYSAYYDVMADLDICVPAFGPLDGYYARQASSTVAMCMQVNVCSVFYFIGTLNQICIGPNPRYTALPRVVYVY